MATTSSSPRLATAEFDCDDLKNLACVLSGKKEKGMDSVAKTENVFDKPLAKTIILPESGEMFDASPSSPENGAAPTTPTTPPTTAKPTEKPAPKLDSTKSAATVPTPTPQPAAKLDDIKTTPARLTRSPQEAVQATTGQTPRALVGRLEQAKGAENASRQNTPSFNNVPTRAAHGAVLNATAAFNKGVDAVQTNQGVEDKLQKQIKTDPKMQYAQKWGEMSDEQKKPYGGSYERFIGAGSEASQSARLAKDAKYQENLANQAGQRKIPFGPGNQRARENESVQNSIKAQQGTGGPVNADYTNAYTYPLTAQPTSPAQTSPTQPVALPFQPTPGMQSPPGVMVQPGMGNPLMAPTVKTGIQGLENAPLPGPMQPAASAIPFGGAQYTNPSQTIGAAELSNGVTGGPQFPMPARPPAWLNPQQPIPHPLPSLFGQNGQAGAPQTKPETDWWNRPA